MNPSAYPAGQPPRMPPAIAHHHFDVAAQAPERRLLAWRDQVGHVVDVLPDRDALRQPFNASIDRYRIGRLMFTDCRSDALRLERSLVRISRDNIRDFAFHVFLEGGVDDVTLRNAPRPPDARGAARVLAVDLGQPVRLWRHACRMLTFFVPAELVQEVFPDPQAIHGRTLHDGMPLLPLAIGQVAALGQTMRGLDARQAQADIITCVRLLLAAFGKDARLAGNARAAGRAAMVAEVRRYVQANLHQAGLTPESVIQALRLPRPTVYRLFQHEGGLGAYIRQLRLRLAAEELARYPHLTVMEIAYGLGFGSASDFARAFRRAYDMPPQEFREQSWRWPGWAVPRA
ncbi:helix-turn-helix transcriptional regulator [Achromobacter xylosoxidans]|uniref:helix-turn-helix transcriptional regulator n=1 Tax=Alcaligenes xylosoxydans xylosoxydans TaxID=85698 RepID=UPI001F055FD2|nr:AraC family transcriptional regulator [Achromobacter xylosoxidans]MCH1987402.1 AraC family transcriptional regulator [Achromobacter xylosoxidans]MCH4584529.1 AraC family transcriptional regulator [Achromobacter xylosoxidans]